jgi:hypothetical protein
MTCVGDAAAAPLNALSFLLAIDTDGPSIEQHPPVQYPEFHSSRLERRKVRIAQSTKCMPLSYELSYKNGHSLTRHIEYEFFWDCFCVCVCVAVDRLLQNNDRSCLS